MRQSRIITSICLHQGGDVVHIYQSSLSSHLEAFSGRASAELDPAGHAYTFLGFIRGNTFRQTSASWLSLAGRDMVWRPNLWQETSEVA